MSQAWPAEPFPPEAVFSTVFDNNSIASVSAAIVSPSVCGLPSNRAASAIAF